MNTDGWTDAQRHSFDSFRNWRRFIASVHNRPESPIEIITLDDCDGTLFLETDGFAWSISEDGTLDPVG